MSQHQKGCGCTDCAIGPFARNHYFTGKLLVERDFRDEQKYYIDKLRHHNQRLHGTGVVCGLLVVPHDNVACRTRYVCVEPGTAVDCCGRDILVVEKTCVDITALDAHKVVADNPNKEYKLQICIRYKECPTENIPVLFDDCDCDDTACAPNRILESFEIGLIVSEVTVVIAAGAPQPAGGAAAPAPAPVPAAAPGDCLDKLLHPCPGCDSGDCLILATIDHYHAGDSMEAMPSPVPNPIPANTAYIDNKTDRVILPSVQSLLEVLKCIHDGGGAPPPPPSLADYPKIIDIGWTHNDTIPYEDFRNRHAYTNKPDDALKTAFLVIYFSKAKLQGVTPQSLQVSIHYPQLIDRRRFTGMYNTANMDLYGYLRKIDGPMATPHTVDAASNPEQAAEAWAYIPEQDFFQYIESTGLLGDMFAGLHIANSFKERLAPPVVEISLRGDFVFADTLLPPKPESILDGENIAGRVGFKEQRPGVTPPPSNPSGNGSQGGTFLSWFALKPPLVNVNGDLTTSPAKALPLDDNALIKLAAVAKQKPFANAVDFAKRSGLDSDTLGRIQDVIKFQ